jgi:hypothetical protein
MHATGATVAGAGRNPQRSKTFAQVEKQFPNATRRELELKGNSDKVIAWEIGRG